ncbi:MAG: glycosyltransferase, partial [Rhodospirillales bacterium]|nr:glycosyltransferase [Rhodospirillales bacterium]
MKIKPEKPANAALFYHPDAVESGGSKLMGRHAAGEGFLTGFVRYSDADAFYCHCANEAHFADFQTRVGAVDSLARPSHWIPFGQQQEIGGVGCLSLPTPSLAGAAWRRRSGDTRAYSICGVNHTIASEVIMDGLGELLTSPVQPWDAVICTSRAVRATVRRLIGNWAEYLNQRTGGNVALGLQLPVIPLGVHCDTYAPGKQADETRNNLRIQFGIEEDDVAVLFMGRLSFHAKAHPLPMYLALEEAARRTGKKIHLIQAGWFANEGIESEFREGAKAFCPSVNAIFLDGRDATVRSRIWFVADIFCSLSDNIQETFGLTPIEAMAAGLPSVVSDWDGYRDTIRHGIDGFAIPTWMPPAGAGLGLELPVDGQLSQADRDQAYNHYCGYISQATAIDVPACMDAFSALVDDAGLRRKMGDAARVRAREVFDWQVVVSAYQALWQELTAIRRTAPEIAPLSNGRPAHPLRDDPFALFSAYPTRPASGQYGIGPVPSADASRLATVRKRGMNTFAASALPPEQEIDELLDRLNKEGVAPLRDFVAKVPTEKRAGALRGIGWLGKSGLARILPASDEPAQTGNAAAAAPLAERLAAAERRWTKRLDADAGDVAALKGMANIQKARGDGHAVVHLLRRALERDPDDFELYNALGEALGGINDLDGAVACLQRAVMASPASVLARRNLAKAYFSRGDRAHAIDEYFRAVRIAPSDAELWFWLGMALRYEGEAEAALECFEKCESLAGQNANLLCQKGMAFKTSGNLKAAEKAFQGALDDDPGNVHGLAGVASMEADRKARRRRNKEGVKRVALHMSQGFHFSILRRLFAGLAAKHHALLSGDARELMEFDPDVVVVCDAQSQNLRQMMPNAKFVFVRHGLISKKHLIPAAQVADFTCVSSETFRQRVVDAGLPEDRVWATGYVQMDPLFSGPKPALPFTLARKKKTVVFAPTYNPLMSAAPVLGPGVAELIRGGRDDISIIVKPHPHICAFQSEWMSWWRTLAETDPDFYLVEDANADLVDYLFAADVMVSDASSAAFQF